MKKEMVMICVMVAVCLLILGTTAQAGLTVVTPRAVTTQLNEVVVMQTTTVATPLRVRAFYRATPTINVEFAPRVSRNYTVVSEDATPWVRSGLFRDRIVQPRRPVLTLIETP